MPANLSHPLSGVYAAAVTPLTQAGAPDLAAWPRFLQFLAERGAHGALLLGTTGEGPSFSAAERIAIWKAAAAARPADFKLMAGTGTPSLSESIALNKAAFDLGYEAVVVLPPFFFRNASEDGLFTWFAELIERSVPEGRWLLGYHIPAVSGVALSVKLLKRLQSAYPTKFGGLKDSTGDLESAKTYAAALPGCAVLVGNDKLLAPGMQAGAAGCITALANLRSAELRAIYETLLWNDDPTARQAALDPIRAAMDAMPPAPAYLKALLHAQHDLALWPVRAPLLDFSSVQTEQALAALEAIPAFA
jgi:4-hydroxy-tetrahydrodipicolinate synthase